MKYRTILADPPWRQKGGPLHGGIGEGFVGGDGRSRDLPYPPMTVAQIEALPVSSLASAHAHLYLWTTNKYLEAAFGVARAWGFQFSTLLTWRKAIMGGGLGGAFGLHCEYVLFCRRGSLAAQQRVRGTVFDYKRPYDDRGKPRHSAKPPEFIADWVEQVSPGPYVELFSRADKPRLGWEYWGDESLATAQMPEAAA